MSLSHVEILSEVLVSAPPICVDHSDFLVSSDLMEVCVSHVVFVTVSWETSVRVGAVIMFVDFSNVPFPLGNHIFFFLFCKQIQHEGLIKMEYKEHVYNSYSVLTWKICNFPKSVPEWIFEKSGNVFKRSPFLSHISWFACSLNEFSEISICFLSESSIVFKILIILKMSYLPIISALSFMFGFPYIRPSIPVSLCLKCDFGFSLSYKYSVIYIFMIINY